MFGFSAILLPQLEEERALTEKDASLIGTYIYSTYLYVYVHNHDLRSTILLVS